MVEDRSGVRVAWPLHKDEFHSGAAEAGADGPLTEAGTEGFWDQPRRRVRKALLCLGLSPPAL